MLQLDKLGNQLMSKLTGQENPDTGMSEADAKDMEERLKEGKMTFNDFLKQVQVMQKAAGLQSMLSKSPFGNGQVTKEQVEDGQKKLKRYSEFVEQMDDQERSEPELMIAEMKSLRAGSSAATATRITRIAEASGATVEDVGKFVLEFSTMRSAAVRMARGDNPDDIKRSMMEEQQAEGGKTLNRKMRRMQAKKTKKKPPAAGGFGRR